MRLPTSSRMLMMDIRSFSRVTAAAFRARSLDTRDIIRSAANSSATIGLALSAGWGNVKNKATAPVGDSLRQRQTIRAYVARLGSGPSGPETRQRPHLGQMPPATTETRAEGPTIPSAHHRRVRRSWCISTRKSFISNTILYIQTRKSFRINKSWIYIPRGGRVSLQHPKGSREARSWLLQGGQQC